jgi:hypothetical protein
MPARHLPVVFLLASCAASPEWPPQETRTVDVPPAAPAPPPPAATPAPPAAKPPPPAAEPPPGPIADPSPARPKAPSAVYAELFVKGRKWVLTGESIHSSFGQMGPDEKSSWEATCVVDETRELDWALATHLDCSSDAGDVSQRIGGWWLATVVGLFYVGELPATARALGASELVLPAAPKERLHESAEDPRVGGTSTLAVSHDGQAWCVREADSIGDESWRTICIEPGKGIVSGNWGWAGGSSIEHTFTAK